MDEIDKKLIKLLKKNARATYLELGEKTGLSEAAVRRRVKKLVEAGIIKRFTIELSIKKEAEAICMVIVNPSIPTSKIRERIEEIENVEWAREIAGRYDIAVFISGDSIAEVNESVEKIRRLKGVERTETFFVLK